MLLLLLLLLIYAQTYRYKCILFFLMIVGTLLWGIHLIIHVILKTCLLGNEVSVEHTHTHTGAHSHTQVDRQVCFYCNGLVCGAARTDVTMHVHTRVHGSRRNRGLARRGPVGFSLTRARQDVRLELSK